VLNPFNEEMVVDIEEDKVVVWFTNVGLVKESWAKQSTPAEVGEIILVVFVVVLMPVQPS